MALLFKEWSYLPDVLLNILTSPQILGILFLGVVLGYIIGVIPGLGPTMGMALSLGVIYKIEPEMGMALLIGIMMSSIGSGGITASLANIPGTAAAAATCIDGYALTQKGQGREAVGLSYVASIIGTVTGIIIIFLIQPFVTTIALKFGDWEVFLFCIFGLMICGSLSGDVPVKGWIAAGIGVFLSLVGADGVQSVVRFNFGINYLLSGFDMVVALIGLFGLGEVLYTLIKGKDVESIKGDKGFPIIKTAILIKNIPNIVRSTFAGIWIGFIPGVGESAACWFSYDIAKRNSKNKEKFGNGSEEGIIAAEVANNSSSIGALIPGLALGVPGSATVAIFLAALFMMNYRPGPTLMMEAPGIISEISVLFVIAAAMLLVVGYFLSRFVIQFLTIPNSMLMPLITVFCALGAYGTTYTMFSMVILVFFGLIGLVMKLYKYPIAPMVLGLLIGDTADVSLRRAIMQYAADPLDLITRPFGLGVIAVLVILFIVGLKTSK